MASVKLPATFELDGENMLAALRGEQAQRTKPLFWDWSGTERPPTNWPRWAILDGDWKLLRDEGQRVELYHLTDDGGEQTNVAAGHPEIVARLSAGLDAWKAALPKEPPADCLSRKRSRLKAASPSSDE